MKIKELMEKLKEFPKDANIEIDFKYDDSDEGVCYDSITDLKFNLTEKELTKKEQKEKIYFLHISEKE